MTTATTTTPPPAHRAGPPVGSVVLVVIGVMAALLGLASLAGGGALVWANATQRDADGYFTTGTQRFETSTAAITSERIDLGATDEAIGLGDSTTVRLRAQATAPGRSVFVGIARQQDLDGYLAGVAHAEIRSLRARPFAVTYNYVDGTARATPPARSQIWQVSADGIGSQQVDWHPTSGEWALVVMNADGTPGVSVTASAGAKATWVLPVGIGLVAEGTLVLTVGTVLLVLGVLGLTRHAALAREGGAVAVAPIVGGNPVRLEGRLDEPINRWLWLVKWLLLIPHVIVLVVLWIAFTVVSIVAFFAILFTGRYPRSLFEFNTGVLRWTWRVNYYGYSALATDRYPPFSLGHDPTYPATLEIDYPPQLSRGLVLVKWWLLAIPHYLVLALIGGGFLVGAGGGGLRTGVPFGGLIGILVVFAAVAVLVSGEYPRSIFDLVIGLNRWVYRVIAYAALLRDEYPPFRLDQGPNEPPAPQDDRAVPASPIAPASTPAAPSVPEAPGASAAPAESGAPAGPATRDLLP